MVLGASKMENSSENKKLKIKIFDIEKLCLEIAKFKQENKQIVFTNGCFDILHVGHVRYLSIAKSKGDILVIGLNSDSSVKAIKGSKRPINSQEHRAEVLSGLYCVDFITIFEETNPLSIIKLVKPDILVKGADWAEKDIIGADFVKALGGKVERVSFVENISTSKIIEFIKNNI